MTNFGPSLIVIAAVVVLTLAAMSIIGWWPAICIAVAAVVMAVGLMA